MRVSVTRSSSTYRRGTVYEVDDCTASAWINKGIAERSDTRPGLDDEVYKRLSASGKTLFLPDLSEFGHKVMTGIRRVHFTESSHKVVCCKPGEEVLYPSADEFITDWIDPVKDVQRIATMPRLETDWSRITSKYPQHRIVQMKNTERAQDGVIIYPEKRIDFKPKLRGLRADIVLGIRNREYLPQQNWRHWQMVGDGLTANGLSFAVVGSLDTSEHIDGEVCHSGDYDTDLAIELLQTCALFVGTDSGTSHLAATVGAEMLIFREPSELSRPYLAQMQRLNPSRVELMEGYSPHAWNDPTQVGRRIIQKLGLC